VSRVDTRPPRVGVLLYRLEVEELGVAGQAGDLYADDVVEEVIERERLWAAFLLAGMLKLVAKRCADGGQQGVAELGFGIGVVEDRDAMQGARFVRSTSARCAVVKNPRSLSMSSHGGQ
jgi:hypothetical protein